MIIVKLMGGLGNQLFQYAAGKALATHHKVPHRLDLSHFDEKGLRNFELPKLHIDAEIAGPEDMAPYTDLSIMKRAAQKLFIPHYNRRPFKQPYFHYYKHFLKAPKSCYLKGYWQSEKYFETVKEQVRHECKVQLKYVQHLQDKADQLQQENSLSVHIRRGDYLNKETINYHGILPRDYYNKAISHIASMEPKLKIYFFSDDIEWVRKNIDIGLDHEFISGTTTTHAIEDFYLMQHCTHNIIANSSFSWWCAWLNNNSKKIVIAPERWFNAAGDNTKDLIPPAWLRM